ncbi:MAG: hypothetical protein PHH08_00575 [Candidatus ainarchaeum sp.]|nr:hypothetical protein [Candidatus ainarchaeum sp.]
MQKRKTVMECLTAGILDPKEIKKLTGINFRRILIEARNWNDPRAEIVLSNISRKRQKPARKPTGKEARVARLEKIYSRMSQERLEQAYMNALRAVSRQQQQRLREGREIKKTNAASIREMIRRMSEEELKAVAFERALIKKRNPTRFVQLRNKHYSEQLAQSDKQEARDAMARNIAEANASKRTAFGRGFGTPKFRHRRDGLLVSPAGRRRRK